MNADIARRARHEKASSRRTASRSVGLIDCVKQTPCFAGMGSSSASLQSMRPKRPRKLAPCEVPARKKTAETQTLKKSSSRSVLERALAFSSADVKGSEAVKLPGRSDPQYPRNVILTTEVVSVKDSQFCGVYTHQDIRAKFRELDKDGDNELSLQEVCAALRNIYPDKSAEELMEISKSFDVDGDSQVDFDEFVNFIFKMYSQTDAPNWAGADRLFDKVVSESGRTHMVLRDFLRICKDKDLFDIKGFGKTEAELLFSQTKLAGTPGLGREQFRLALKRIAKKKCCPANTIVAWVAST